MRFFNRFCAFAILILAALSCSKEETKDEISLVSDKTFKEETLQLTYGGQPMLGKAVRFIPDSSNPEKGQIRIVGSSYNHNGFPITTSSIAGKNNVVIDVDIFDLRDASFDFKGSAQCNGFSLSCEGVVNSLTMKLDLTAQMKENPLEGNYELNQDQAMVIEWDCNPITVPPVIKDPWPLQDALTLLVGIIPLVPDPEGNIDENGNVVKVPIIQALQKSLSGVNFYDDGNITAISAIESVPETPKNIAMYSDVTDKDFKLFLNPYGIDANRETSAVKTKQAPVLPDNGDLATILALFTNQLYAKLSDGIDMAYSIDAKGVLTISLDEKTILPLITPFKSFFESEENITMVKDMIILSLPDNMADKREMVETMVPVVLGQVPGIIESTKKINIGINLIERSAAN